MAAPLLLAVGAAVILSVVFYLLQSLYIRLRFNLPPGPRPLPIVGNLYDVKPVKFRCYADWARTYGPIFSVYLDSKLNVIVNSSELAKEVLKENDQQLADRHRNRATMSFSRGGKDLIWADYGPHYVKVRKVCNLELFSPKRLEALRPIREDEVTAMVESIFNDSADPDNRGKGLVMRGYLGSVAFNNITRLTFGKRFVNSEGGMDEQGKEFKGIVSNGIKIGGKVFMAENIPWLRWFFAGENDILLKHEQRRDRLTKAIMAEHDLARKKTGGAQEHFIDALHTLQQKYDLSDDTIIGLLWDMITAGMDTTSISAEWAMAELVKNPRVQQKAQEELDRVIGMDRIMSETDISKLPYLQSIAKEALRLHPPTPLMLPHKANSHVKLGGYDVPKGGIIHVNVWAIARDPTIWKDPDEFRPERFFEEDVDVKGHDFRLLPFGAGRRVCPGAQLAINLVTSMLGHVLHHFEWTPPAGVKPEEVDLTENPGMVTYMRTPLQAVATPRLPNNLYKRVPDMIIARTDTTSISAEWAMAELVKNPQIQQKAQEELDSVIGTDRIISETDISKLLYLQSIAKEALQLNPRTPLTLPHKKNSYVKFGGHDVPKGGIVHVNVKAIACDPTIWKDPDEFRRERFFEEDVGAKGHDLRLLPVGAGRQVCSSAQLAINLVRSMLGHLLHHFEWTPPVGVKPEEADLTENLGMVTCMWTPLQAVATPRLLSNLYKWVPV